MNLLSRRSVLAIAAVVDVALHSRSAPVAAKALAARHKLPPRAKTPRLNESKFKVPRFRIRPSPAASTVLDLL
jgi:hypothetical protein